MSEAESVYPVKKTDRKYLVDPATVVELVASLDKGWRVLEIDGGRLLPYDKVYFDTDKASLQKRSFALLNEIADTIRANPQLGPSEGHIHRAHAHDRRPCGVYPLRIVRVGGRRGGAVPPAARRRAAGGRRGGHECK